MSFASIHPAPSAQPVVVMGVGRSLAQNQKSKYPVGGKVDWAGLAQLPKTRFVVVIQGDDHKSTQGADSLPEAIAIAATMQARFGEHASVGIYNRDGERIRFEVK